MPKRIDSLTSAQKAAMSSHADRWIARGLDCSKPDWDEWERGVSECYSFANLDFPSTIVRVPNPLVGAIAFPIAALLIEQIERQSDGDGAVDGAVDGPVDGAVGEAVYGAVDEAVRRAVGGAVGGPVREAVDEAVRRAVRRAVDGAVDEAVRGAVDEAVRRPVDGAVGEAVRRPVDEAVRRAVRRAVGGPVDEAVRGAVDEAVRRAVRRAVDGAVRGAVDGAVDGAVGGAVGGPVRGAVGGPVDGAVGEAVYGAVDEAVRRAIGEAVDGAVGGPVRGAVLNKWSYFIGGQFWGGCYWGSARSTFFRDICKLDLTDELWEKSRSWERANTVGWWWPHKKFVMVCERPRYIRREQIGPRGWGSHRLHCEDGPAIAWDGWELYFWHGIRVPNEAFTQPGWLDAKRITSEQNAELRRTYMEIYGRERYIREAGGKLLDEVAEPPFPGLINARLWKLPHKPEDLVCVELRNSTPEPSGEYRSYSLWVPPTMTSAHEAVAWTFGETKDSYLPVVET